MYLMPSLPQSNIKEHFYKYPVPELEDRDEEENETTIIQSKQPATPLGHTQVWELDGIQPRVPKELEEVLGEPFSIIH